MSDNKWPTVASMPKAMEAAQDFIRELQRAELTFTLMPSWNEDSREPTGIDVGIDVGGADGFALWVVMNFREDGLHGDGYILRHCLPIARFERSSLDYWTMADGLAKCRAGKWSPSVADKESSIDGAKCNVRILEFQYGGKI